MTIHSTVRSMPFDQQSALLNRLLAERDHRQRTNRLRLYSPYAKQRAFHAAGAKFGERLFMAGNQLGKTIAGGAEWAIHLTGRYPDWWEGAVFDRPPVLWAGSVTSESTRKNPQRILIGPPEREEEWGTGFIPKDCLRDTTRAIGVPNLLDSVVVKWGGGGDVQSGEGLLHLIAYEKGREKWQGPTVDGVWFDEEPPPEIYSEGLTRTNNGQRGQFAQMTFTPLKGMSEVVTRYLRPEGGDAGASNRSVTTMTIDDAEHYSPEERAKIIASYHPHEREARTLGVPSLGAGAIYPVPFGEVVVKPIEIPRYWKRAYALDVGWNRTAAVWGAQDPSDGVIYLYAEHYRGEEFPIVHAQAIKARGDWIKGTIDPGARGRQQGDGLRLIEQYRSQGLDLVPANNEVDAGIYEVWQRLGTGRLRIFSTLQNLEQEYRGYHRDEKGKVVKKFDHLMDAMRYLIMTWDKIASVQAPKRGFTSAAIGDRGAGY